LHRAVDGAANFTFVTVAEWESAEQFMAALGSAERRELEKQLIDFPHYPGVYEAIRT
jgi:hypothetical protein